MHITPTYVFDASQDKDVLASKNNQELLLQVQARFSTISETVLWLQC